MNRRALLASSAAAAICAPLAVAYSPADLWLMQSLAYHYRGWPMGRGLAIAGRIDAHGRDRSNRSLYPVGVLREALPLASWEEPALPIRRDRSQLRAECEAAQPFGGWWPDILRMASAPTLPT